MWPLLRCDQLSFFQFSLHLNMAEQSMGLFETQKLPVVANVEQVCAFSESYNSMLKYHAVLCHGTDS